MTKGLHLFDGALHEANGWLKAAMIHLDSQDPQLALAALRAVLHALRDRIGPGSAAHLGAQLPIVWRGVYYEGWHPERPAGHERHVAAFVEQVRNGLPAGLALDPEAATRACFLVLWEKLDPGAIVKTMHTLPSELRLLWPDRAQARAREAEHA